MADARPDEERLPWLDSPRASAPAAKKARPAPRPRRSRAPILVLLSLFLLAGVGVISYLAGRGSLTPTDVAPARAPAPRTASSATVPLPPPPVVEPAPPPVVEQAEPAPTKRASPPRKRVVRRKVPSSAPAPSALEATRIAQGEAPRPAPVARPAPAPAPVIRATRVVQIGTYTSRSRADAAHRRLAKIYPYVRTLPKVVRPIQPRGSRRIFYRLQYQEYSPDYARILCRNLRAVGRGCAVLPSGR